MRTITAFSMTGKDMGTALSLDAEEANLILEALGIFLRTKLDALMVVNTELAKTATVKFTQEDFAIPAIRHAIDSITDHLDNLEG